MAERVTIRVVPRGSGATVYLLGPEERLAEHTARWWEGTRHQMSARVRELKAEFPHAVVVGGRILPAEPLVLKGEEYHGRQLTFGW